MFSFVYNCYQSCLFLPTSDSPTGETTFAATAELPLLSGNVLSASSKGCGDLADEGMVAQITVAKHRKPNVLPMSNRSFQFLSFVMLLLCKRSFHILIISTLLKLDFGLFIALSVVLIVYSLLARTLCPNKEEDDECHSGSYRGLNRVTSGENLFIAWHVP